ncbi:hypothetical protein D3C87_315560 [compost metagenome]
MKTVARALAASLLLCSPLLATAAAATALTPEQTFDLYARVMLEDDAAAARTLNDALRPAFDGKDAITPTPRALAEAMAAPLQAVLAEYGDTGSGAALADTYAANLRGSHCRAQHSTVTGGGEVPLQATVDFTCQVTDLDSVRPLFQAGMAEGRPDDFKRFIAAYITALGQHARRELRGTLALYPAQGEGYWFSAGLDGLVAPVVEAVAPFAAWSQEAAAAQAPRVTGVPTCDLLLQQHARCMARTAPAQESGVAAMAEELKAKAKVMSPEEMTRECRALRSMAEAMWGDECH